jgi:hypothetical protein
MLLKSAMYFSNTATDSEVSVRSDSKVKSKQASSYELGMSTVSGHSTVRPLQSSISTQPDHVWVSIIQNNEILACLTYFFVRTLPVATTTLLQVALSRISFLNCAVSIHKVLLLIYLLDLLISILLAPCSAPRNLLCL